MSGRSGIRGHETLPLNRALARQRGAMQLTAWLSISDMQQVLTPKGSKSGLMVKSWSWSMYWESVTKVSRGILKYA